MPHEHRSIAFKKPNDLGLPSHPSSYAFLLPRPALSLSRLHSYSQLNACLAQERGPWPRLTRLFATAANSLCQSLSSLLCQPLARPPLINMCCITHTNIIFEPRRVSFRARHRFLRFDIIATRLRRTATAHAQRPTSQTGLVRSAQLGVQSGLGMWVWIWNYLVLAWNYRLQPRLRSYCHVCLLSI